MQGEIQGMEKVSLLSGTVFLLTLQKDEQQVPVSLEVPASNSSLFLSRKSWALYLISWLSWHFEVRSENNILLEPSYPVNQPPLHPQSLIPHI